MTRNKPYPLYDSLPAISSLPEMVAFKLREQPEDTAFAFFDRKGNCCRKSYLEFAVKVRSTAEWIAARGLPMRQAASRQKYSRQIGILGENSYDWLVMFMAVICSGNVAVALDKDMSQEELLQAVGDADVSLILHSAKAGKKLDTIRKAAENAGSPDEGSENQPGESAAILPACVLFDEVCAASRAENEAACAGCEEAQEKNAFVRGELAAVEYFGVGAEDPDALCCMFFTSGTSGRRKAVMLSHRNIAADINGSCKLFALGGSTYAVLPFHHAFGLIVGVWMVFHYGHTVYISSGLKRISSEIKTARPQTMMLVPLFVESFYKQISQEVKRSGRQKQMKAALAFSNVLRRCGMDVRKRLFADALAGFGGKLEYIICGGAALDRFYVEKFRMLGIEILDGYGTTECAPVVAVNRNRYHRDESVGLAVPGTEVVIAPDGEVLVRGPNVMLGYYNEGKDAGDDAPCGGAYADGVDDGAWEKIDRDGFYHTGDLGRIDRDGFIFLTGRKKNLIILSNGENVSPEELEEKLLRFDTVREVLVLAKDGRICAEVYPEAYCGTEQPDEDAVRAGIQADIDSLCRQLPAYKQITELILRDRPFEKTTTQKIRR